MSKVLVSMMLIGLGLAIVAIVLAIKDYRTPQMSVCKITQDQSVIVAAVDPASGQLFGVRTLQRVCLEPHNNQGK